MSPPAKQTDAFSTFRTVPRYLWDAKTEHYRTGPDREDTLVLKWAMEAGTEDLTLQAERSYRADIWYWKADRTDPVGYADDKIQIYSRGKMPQAIQLWSSSGRTFYLHRNGDEGNAAYATRVYPEYAGERVPKFFNQQPSDSRADIRAKGQWQDGHWTIRASGTAGA